MKTSDTKTEEKAESTDLDYLKEDFESKSIKDLRLIREMVNTTLDLKTAEARHKGKFASKKKNNGIGAVMESAQYRDPDEDYI